MKSDDQIQREFNSRLAITRRGLASQYDNSALCDAFYSGDLNNYRGDNIVLGAELRKMVGVQINKGRPYIDAVNGFMIQNRREAKYAAVDENQEQQVLYSKNANSIAGYVRRNARAEQIEAVGSKQMLIKGYGAVATAMTYGEGYATRDPNGEVIMADVSNEVGWDPMARASNLLDARWVYYRKSYSLEDAMTLFRKSDEDDFGNGSWVNGFPDTGYQYDPAIGPKYDRSKYDEGLPAGFEWDSKSDRTVWVYFYEWYETENFYRANNPLANIQNPMVLELAQMQVQVIADEAKEQDDMFAFDPAADMWTFDGSTKTKLVELFEDLIKPFKFTRKVFYSAVLSGTKVFTSYRSLSQQGFTVKFKTGIWDNHKGIWTGMANPMIEPTKYFNKALTELIYTIAANSKGGWIAEETAIPDMRDFEYQANKTDGIAIVADGALNQNRVQPKKAPFTPTGYEQIIQLADASISDVTGIDPTFLGSSENRMQTAQLQRQIVQRVVSTLAAYFDSAMAYQTEHARLLLDYLRTYVENNEGGVKRLIDDRGEQQFLTMSSDMFANEYDVDIVEAPQTPDEKQQRSELLSGMAIQLFGVQHPAAPLFLSAAVKDMALEADTKQELVKALTPPDDPRILQLQQQIQQLTGEQNKAQMDNLAANTMYSQAKAEQALSTIAKTQAETMRTQVETSLAPYAQLDKISVGV